PETPRPPDLLPVDDFIRMPELAPVTQPVTSRVALVAAPQTNSLVPVSVAPKPAGSSAQPKRSRMLKPAKARRAGRWGSTRCPVF
ncbi:MAG: hypothetical protein LH609_13020, partial [Rudanella sp.]|nr:hypothetical protein [Rudanella sp.]